MNSLVSVIIPTYNRAHLINETIESVISQTYKNLEIIIIDDGSTDNTEEVISHIKDDRIKYMKQVNQGTSVARNSGLNYSNGEFIAVLDSDDIWLPEKLSIQLEFLKQNPNIGVCATSSEFIRENKTKIFNMEYNSEDIKALMLFYSPVIHSSVVIRNDLLKKHNIQYSTNLRSSLDYDLLVRLSKVTDLYCMPDILVQYKQHNDQITHNRSWEQIRNANKIRHSLLKELVVDFAEEEFALHEEISTMNFPKTIKTFKEISSWFEKLLSTNREKQVYPQRNLEKAVAHMWISLVAQGKKQCSSLAALYLFSSISLNIKAEMIKYKLENRF